MRKMIGLALAAVALVPTVASAQTAELRRDRQEIRQEQRDLARAHRSGDRRDIREERRELAQAQREYRRDLRDHRRDSWRELRERDRARYRMGRYTAPRGYTSGYRRWATGSRLQPAFYGRTYRIANPRYYGLPPSGKFQGWVRYYNDVMLVDVRDGRVYEVIPGFFY